MDCLVSYISEKKLFRYGKLEKVNGCFKVFALSLIIPMEPSPRFVKLDKIINMASHLSCLVSLNFVIDGLEEELKFYCISEDENIILYLKKILFGEIRLRSKYCSEIFVYVNFERGTDSCNFYDFVQCDKCNSDKIYLYSFNTSENGNPNFLYLISYDTFEIGCAIGFSVAQSQFFKKIICPKSNYRVADVYCTFSDLNVDDSNDVTLTDVND